MINDRKKIPTYCYQCVNGPDLLTVEVADGVATEVEPNFAVRGLHPADGKICVKPYSSSSAPAGRGCYGAVL